MQAGIINVTLGGASYAMRPTYGTLRDIEARTSMTAQELLELVIAQRLRIEEAVLIIWYACNAAGEDLESIDALGGVIFAERLTSPDLRASIARFLLNCLYAPKDAQGKWEAEVAPMIKSDVTG